MAKRKVKSRTTRRRSTGVKRSSSRPAARKTAARRGGKSSKKAAKSLKKSAKRRPVPRKAAPSRPKAERREPTRLNRPRRSLEEVVPTPPSSLDLDRHASAARSGRAGAAENRANRANLTPAITAGDADVDVEDAYFTGDEAPGGDNSTPDQDVVDDIGKAIGVEYQDDEELRGSDKVTARDKHRWELDPASSEDYRERKK
jgi:hypothetical protein